MIEVPGYFPVFYLSKMSVVKPRCTQSFLAFFVTISFRNIHVAAG